MSRVYMFGEEIVEGVYEDNEQVYGRNLVLNSELAVITSDDSDRNFLLTDSLEASTYTLSFDYDIKIETTPIERFLLYTDRSIERIPITPDGGRVKFTFEVQERDIGKSLTIYAGSDASQARDTTMDFIEIKLERGNKASDWTPAPEDLIDSLKPQTYPLAII